MGGSVPATLFRTAVEKEQVAEYASGLSRTGGFPISVTFIVLVVAVGLSEFRSYVKVEVAVLGSPS